jgi:hypothetical protein
MRFPTYQPFSLALPQFHPFPLPIFPHTSLSSTSLVLALALTVPASPSLPADDVSVIFDLACVCVCARDRDKNDVLELPDDGAGVNERKAKAWCGESCECEMCRLDEGNIKGRFPPPPCL